LRKIREKFPPEDPRELQERRKIDQQMCLSELNELKWVKNRERGRSGGIYK
jgi:hypothetical protein